MNYPLTALSLEIVKSWFSLMDDDGWIPREQILGPEARSKVPTEFQVQYPHYANPPTLFFILDTFLNRISDTSTHSSQESLYTAHTSNPAIAHQYLSTLYPLLKRHYEWFHTTQRGDLKSYDRPPTTSSKEAYRWRGRTPQHILTSGLDDYPRAQPPHPGELHLDLISWMGLLSRSLHRIAMVLDQTEDAAEFKTHHQKIVANIDTLHWSEKSSAYCDATIDEYEEHALVCHKGYISLFPFITGLLPSNSERLGKVLDLIADPDELWSDFGIRSLSKKDVFYGTEENYWRSPIWVNINYLILVQLLVCECPLIEMSLRGPSGGHCVELHFSSID